MLFLGDVAHPLAEPPDWPIGRPWREQPVVVNFEGPLSDDAGLLQSRCIFNHPSVLGALDAYGVRVASLANNHITDVPQLFGATLEALRARDIAVVGAGRNFSEACAAVQIEHEGIEYTLLSFGWSAIQCRPASEGAAGVNPLRPDHVLDSVKCWRQKSPNHALVVIMHWNFEMELYPQPAHRQLAMAAIEAGADIIVGHHPHCVGGIEFYRGKPIAYSIGNWWLPQGKFFGGTVIYAEAAKVHLALEWNPRNGVKCHWYAYETDANTLVHIGSEMATDSGRLRELTPFQDMPHQEYQRWFAEHRVKWLLLPIYRDMNSTRLNAIKDQYLVLRHGGIRALEISGLRSVIGQARYRLKSISQLRAIKAVVDNKDSIYASLPVSGQNIVCSIYGAEETRKRLGKTFRERYEWLKQTERYSSHEIADYQDQQVERIVRHAYDYVPHYRSLMNASGLKPTDIRGRADLEKLPILRKDDVVRSYDALLARGYQASNVYERRTSGTTGTAMRFASSGDSIAFQWAVWWRHRARFNVYPGDRHVNFTGKLVVPPGQTAPPYWRWNWPMRQALINMQQITPAHVPAIADFLNRGGFKYYSGYPSIIHALAMQLKELGLKISKPPLHTFLGAENVQDYQKAGIEEVFNTKVTDQYGLSEGCANASRCEHGSYHEDWEFSMLECIDPEVLPDGDIRGRIVAVGFANDAFPFIRYETGDYGVWAPDDYQCPCGRASRVIRRIEGRVEDYVITPEGLRIMRFDYLFKQTDSIKEAQVIQYQLGEIVIKVVPRPGYTKRDEDLIIQGVREWISPKLRVTIELVDAIERSAGGKFRPVLSKLETKVRAGTALR